MTLVTRSGAARIQLIMSLSRDDSPRTGVNRTAQMSCRPLPRLPRPATAKIMIVIASLVMTTATTVVAPSVQEPLPLPGATPLLNSSVVHERMMRVAMADVYQHVLAVLTAMLVNGDMENWRSDLPRHHAGGRSLTDCRPTTAQANEMQWRTGLMIEVLSQMLTRPPIVRSRRVSAGTMADVEEGRKAVEDSQLVLKVHLAVSRYPLVFTFRYKYFSGSNIFLASTCFPSGRPSRATPSHHGTPDPT